MKKHSLFIAFLLIGMLLLSGCMGNQKAQETTSVVLLRYGMVHDNELRKTVIALSSDLSLAYHIYPAETEEYEINYDGNRRLGPAVPIVEVISEIPAEHWAALRDSDSLRGLWNKSKAVGEQEVLGGVDVLLLTVSTPTATKVVGSAVIDDRWLYETAGILEQLALNSEVRPLGEEKLDKYLAEHSEDSTEETSQGEEKPPL